MHNEENRETNRASAAEAPVRTLGYAMPPQRRHEWRKVVKSGEKWLKVVESGEKLLKVMKSGEKWRKVAKSG